MFSVSLDGAEALQARLDDLPLAVQAAVRAKAADLAERLRAHVVDDKLSGQVLRSKTGALAGSIGAEVAVEGDQVRARVFSAGDLKYARIQEYGGVTPAHQIVPSKARALAFIAGGAQVFARRVQHPGSVIPERSYLRSSLADMAGQITAELKAAVVNSLAETSP
jgi:hypothetical protein